LRHKVGKVTGKNAVTAQVGNRRETVIVFLDFDKTLDVGVSVKEENKVFFKLAFV
jgi:hypothetical protein